MPDSKITALTALTAADPAVDMFPVVDVSDTTMAASGTTKRISINNILACSPAATLASATITGQLTAATSSGHIGFGTSPSAWGSSIKGVDLGAWTSVAQIGAASFYGFNSYASTTGQFNYKNSGAIASGYFQTTSGHLWLNAPSNAGAAGANATFTTAMTLDASGNLLVGKTVNNITTVGFQSTSTGEVSAALAASTNAATQWTTYSTGAAAYRFYVGMGGTVFATNTTISAISDARLKENVQDLDVGLGAILALKPRKFDWKEGKGKNIKGDRGFIAQEFETVFPNLIDEWKDEAPEGEAPYKSVRQDLIPVLVKAIQELAAEVNALKNA